MLGMIFSLKAMNCYTPYDKQKQHIEFLEEGNSFVDDHLEIFYLRDSTSTYYFRDKINFSRDSSVDMTELFVQDH